MDSLPTKKRAKKRARLAARHKQGRDTVRATPPGPHAARTRPGTRPGARQDAPLLILFGMSRSLTRLPLRLRSLMNRNVRDLFTE